MILPKETPPTLERERGLKYRVVLTVEMILVADPLPDFKRQCLKCDDWFDLSHKGDLCPDCLTFNPNQLLLLP